MLEKSFFGGIKVFFDETFLNIYNTSKQKHNNFSKLHIATALQRTLFNNICSIPSKINPTPSTLILTQQKTTKPNNIKIMSLMQAINNDPTTQDTALVTQFKDFMGRQLRCHISDGRIITGSFDCIDKHRNIILDRATEIKSIDKPNTTRSIGYVLIPGEHLIKCEVENDAE